MPESHERLIRGCDGVILVYTITSRKSFDSVKKYYDQVRRIKDGNHVPIFLVGSRRDLEARRQVAPIEAVVLAAKLRLGEPFREISAKTGENVNEVFTTVIREIRRAHAETGTQKFFKSIKQLFGGV
jgi:GTPase KRas